mgnify:CR=1 FL=1
MDNYENLSKEILAQPANISVQATEIYTPEEEIPSPDGLEHSDTSATAPPSLTLMTEAQFLKQWGNLHDMAGGMIQMRTGEPVPLGDAARNEGGQMAGSATYELIKSNPMLAKIMLNTQSTFWGQMAIVGMHGFACVQIVSASRNPKPVDSAEVRND